jgi:hypothetical protein
LILFIFDCLVVYSNLQFYYSLFFVLRSLKTAVNSICLGTCSSFTPLTCKRLSKRVQSTTSFYLAVFFEFFENFRFPFLPYSPVTSATTYSTCLRTCSGR